MTSEKQKDLERLKVFKEYENGICIGVVHNLKNVNSNVWFDFKKIALLYGNSEGAALTACVMAWKQNLINFAELENMKQKKEAKEESENKKDVEDLGYETSDGGEI